MQNDLGFTFDLGSFLIGMLAGALLVGIVALVEMGIYLGN